MGTVQFDTSTVGEQYVSQHQKLSQQKWVITGVHGRVGTLVAREMNGLVGTVVGLDIDGVIRSREEVPVICADILDEPALVSAFEGATGVVHLAGIPDEADVLDLIHSNIIGTRNVLEAARKAGVRRVVFASTGRVSGFYAVPELIGVDRPTRPDSFYGWTKASGEILGRLYWDKFGLEVVCVRIGSFEETPADRRHRSTWVSSSDLARAFRAAVSADEVGFTVFYAVSDNQDRWWDTTPGERLGYHPVDDAARMLPELRPLDAGERQGLPYVSAQYSLQFQRDELE